MNERARDRDKADFRRVVPRMEQFLMNIIYKRFCFAIHLYPFDISLPWQYSDWHTFTKCELRKFSVPQKTHHHPLYDSSWLTIAASDVPPNCHPHPPKCCCCCFRFGFCLCCCCSAVGNSYSSLPRYDAKAFFPLRERRNEIRHFIIKFKYSHTGFLGVVAAYFSTDRTESLN